MEKGGFFRTRTEPADEVYTCLSGVLLQQHAGNVCVWVLLILLNMYNWRVCITKSAVFFFPCKMVNLPSGSLNVSSRTDWTTLFHYLNLKLSYLVCGLYWFRTSVKPPALTLAAKCIAPDVTACSHHRAAVAVARWRADISPASAGFAQIWPMWTLSARSCLRLAFKRGVRRHNVERETEDFSIGSILVTVYCISQIRHVYVW